MSKTDHIFSVVMTLFGFYVVCVANAAIYAPYEAVGYAITLGFVVSVAGIHHSVLSSKK